MSKAENTSVDSNIGIIDVFNVVLSFKGQTSTVSATQRTTVQELYEMAREAFLQDENVTLKLLYKGKVLGTSASKRTELVFPNGNPSRKKPLKIMVMASSQHVVEKLNAGRSDPTIRGFDNEKVQPPQGNVLYWGDAGQQNKNYKFCRLQACTWQSFGHRAGSKTPHAFEAMRLLEKLATDPGVVAIMVERELVVGTLGEMDPVDDVLKKKKEAEGTCLLGYNTNHGTRIDLKLRTNDLQGFLPYDQIVATLIHELSHNWVGEHNALFWTNYGQMRVEYLHKHMSLAATGYVVNGKTTAQLAGVATAPSSRKEDLMKSISDLVLQDCTKEMAQHGIPVQVIAPAVLVRCRELTVDSSGSEQGQRLGGNIGVNINDQSSQPPHTRDLALAAAERRAREREREKDKE